MSNRLRWDRDGRDWPNREASRFVHAAGFEWHVQRLGQGPVVLLAHGTGAATHSWRGLAPILARDFTVIAPDLPGHGFTDTPPPPGLSLPGMARSLAALVRAMDVTPAIAVGHSAGAAVLARMSLDGMLTARALVAINGAMLPLTGIPGSLFSGIARVLVTVPMVPRFFARRARSRAVVERLIRDTGSHLDAAGLRQYARLMTDPGHVSGALAMMASWELKPLERDLPELRVPLTLIASEGDRTVPPGDSVRVAHMVPGAVVKMVPRLGHLAHEEDPQAIADLIREAAVRASVLA
ncbi:MAG TPA: alpha/beta fold hydrolase BchO [Acidisphaera sp.]|nr:alpha/beta fold hydrolase BchO [Acidisphaera sp.]